MLKWSISNSLPCCQHTKWPLNHIINSRYVPSLPIITQRCWYEGWFNKQVVSVGTVPRDTLAQSCIELLGCPIMSTNWTCWFCCYRSYIHYSLLVCLFPVTLYHVFCHHCLRDHIEFKLRCKFRGICLQNRCHLRSTNIVYEDINLFIFEFICPNILVIWLSGWPKILDNNFWFYVKIWAKLSHFLKFFLSSGN